MAHPPPLSDCTKTPNLSRHDGRSIAGIPAPSRCYNHGACADLDRSVGERSVSHYGTRGAASGVPTFEHHLASSQAAHVFFADPMLRDGGGCVDLLRSMSSCSDASERRAARRTSAISANATSVRPSASAPQMPTSP